MGITAWNTIICLDWKASAVRQKPFTTLYDRLGLKNLTTTTNQCQVGEEAEKYNQIIGVVLHHFLPDYWKIWILMYRCLHMPITHKRIETQEHPALMWYYRKDCSLQWILRNICILKPYVLGQGIPPYAPATPQKCCIDRSFRFAPALYQPSNLTTRLPQYFTAPIHIRARATTFRTLQSSHKCIRCGRGINKSQIPKFAFQNSWTVWTTQRLIWLRNRKQILNIKHGIY